MKPTAYRIEKALRLIKKAQATESRAGNETIAKRLQWLADQLDDELARAVADRYAGYATLPARLPPDSHQ